MRHIFIINPTAGTKNCTEMITSQAKALFAERGEEFSVHITEHRGHAEELARLAAESGDETVLYVCGGDGTLGEAASGIAGSKSCALAPVPVGSGNDFVRAFGRGSAEHFLSLRELADGEVIDIDLLSAEGRVCLNIASAGLDAQVCAALPAWRRLPFIGGPLAYKLALAHQFFVGVRNRLAFVVDGEAVPAEDYIFAVAANGSFYGGGFNAAPEAKLSDGLIDFIRVPTLPRARILFMINSYRRGEHLKKYPCVRFSRCRSVRYCSERPVCMNLDGEVFEFSNPTVTVLPKAMRLVVPRALLSDGIC